MEYDDKWQRQQERWNRHQERWRRKQERWARKQQAWGQHQRHHFGIVNGPASGIVFSVAIIAVGTLFLLDNLGIVRFHDVARWWPAILIALGVVRLVDSHGTVSMVWGGLLAGVGSLLLLDNLNLIVFDWRIVWPAILIAWGVLMLLRTTQRSHEPVTPEGGSAPPEGASAPPLVDGGRLSLFAIFGGGDRRIEAKDLRGGEISAIFGGFEVDLRQAGLAAGEATIDCNVVFGGVEIQIPDHWTVEVRGAALFGGFSDETRPPRPDAPTPAPKLIVTGYAMFGGVTVSN